MSEINYFSPGNKGFYSSLAHGARQIEIPDPEWLQGNDPEETAPLISIANPNTAIPVDAIEISVETKAAIDAALMQGKTVDYIDDEFIFIDPVITLDDAKARAKSKINAKYSELMAQVTAGYPQDEIFSWDKQEAEARSGGATPFIDALAIARGIDRTELITRIIAKADAFTLASATLTGTRQKLEDDIDAATTQAEAAAIVWPSA